MNNLNNQTILDNFMEKPESKNQNRNILANTDNEGVSIVGFCGMFRTSRR
jgi:hypothetical protein